MFLVIFFYRFKWYTMETKKNWGCLLSLLVIYLAIYLFTLNYRMKAESQIAKPSLFMSPGYYIKWLKCTYVEVFFKENTEPDDG